MIYRSIIATNRQGHPPGLALIISIAPDALIIYAKNTGVAGLNTALTLALSRSPYMGAVPACFVLADFAGLLFKPGYHYCTFSPVK